MLGDVILPPALVLTRAGFSFTNAPCGILRFDMNKNGLKIGGLIVLGGLLPGLVFAAPFSGTCKKTTGEPGTSPSDCNVPGVIWNTKGTSILQDAQINITDKATVGTFELTQTPSINFFNNLKLENGKAFRVDSTGPTEYYMGNWGAPTGLNPLVFKIYGGLEVLDTALGAGLGKDGRVQAPQFCFTNFGSPDCRSSWPAGGGGTLTGITAGSGITVTGGAPSPTVSINTGTLNDLYVNATGDTMTGPLNITAAAPGFGNAPLKINRTDSGYGFSITSDLGGEFKNTNGDNTYIGSSGYGLQASLFVPNSIGVQASAIGANGVGGDFLGNKKGVVARTGGFGSDNIAVQGSEASIGGKFQGRETGVMGIAPAPAAYSGVAEAVGVMGMSTNTAVTNIGVKGTATGASSQGGFFSGTFAGVNANSPGTAVFGGGGTTGGNFQGSTYGVLVAASTPGVGTAVSGYNGSTGGNFSGSTYGVYGVGGSGSLFYDSSYGTYSYVAYPGYGLLTNQQIYTSGALTAGTVTGYGEFSLPNAAQGVMLGALDRPMITRGWDQFTSGVNAGVGRWGMFMEPSTLTIGIPDTTVGTKYFSVVKYAADGTRTNLFYTDNSGNFVVPAGTASKPGGGSWAVYSDARLKNIHGDFTRGLGAIASLQPISYNYAKGNAENLPSDQTYIGLTAQNVQKAIPEAVSMDENGFLKLNNDPVIWTMLNAIKELKAENDSLKARVEALEKK